MKLLSWNIQGCNNPLKKRLLKRKIQMENLGILFLQETKCSSEELESIGMRFWKGARIVETDATGAAGGIGLLWNPNVVSITNINTTRHIISTQFHILGTVVKGVITNIYGPFQLAPKQAFLDEIHDMEGMGRKGSLDHTWRL